MRTQAPSRRSRPDRSAGLPAQIRCATCRQVNDRTAAFCRSCGQPLAAPRNRIGARNRAGASADSVRCSKCRAVNAAGAEFCRHCGGSLRAQPAAEIDPPGHSQRTSGRSGLLSLSSLPSIRFGSGAVGTAASRFNHANGVVGVGAVTILIGCVLPLAGSMGYEARLVPDIVSRVPEVALVPMSALFLLICAGALYAPIGRWGAVVAGLCVAVASPGFIASLATARMGSEALSRLGPANGLIDIGAGGVFLLVGYALALIGALAVLAHIPTEANTEGSS